MAIELNGGYINKVSLQSNGHTQAVVKRYEGEELIGIPAHQRFRRESLALERHSRHGIAPTLLERHTEISTVVMEYVPHISQLDDHIRSVEPHQKHHILREVGEALRKVHQPVNVDHETYLTRYLTKIEQATTRASELLHGVGLDAKMLYERVITAIDPKEVANHGVTYIHRDPWLNNFLFDGQHIRGLVDWELAGIGSPLEDIAVVDLWVARAHGDIHSFWEGYGKTVDRNTLLGFVLGKCLSLLGKADRHAFEEERKNGDGFYMNKVAIIRDVLAEL